MSDVRDRIARAIYESDKREWAWTWDALVEGGKNRPYPEYPHLVDDYYRQADAVLAALPVRAGVTDEMLETGAKALHAFWNEQPEPFGLPWQRVPEDHRDFYRDESRAVLEAVYGKAEA